MTALGVPYTYTDHLGLHQHVNHGSPYDHNAPITCPACAAAIKTARAALCTKYGWPTWPDALKGSLAEERRRP